MISRSKLHAIDTNLGKNLVLAATTNTESQEV
jgi:hypothetical protein